MNAGLTASIGELVFDDWQSIIVSELVPNAWHGHVPFLFWVLKHLKPLIFVQLGAYSDGSYNTVCQSVQRLTLTTACYGVDAYHSHDQSLHNDGRSHDCLTSHDDQYASFSQMTSVTPDVAINRFLNGSIDLLYINSQYSYEAAKCYFESWFPKLSKKSIVLFPNVNVQNHEMGVNRLFYELSQSYSKRTFSFSHGHGFGMLMIGGSHPTVFQDLCSLMPAEISSIHKAFFILGKSVNSQCIEKSLNTKISDLEHLLIEKNIEQEKLSESFRLEARKREIEGYKAELQLSLALREVRKIYDMLMWSRTMRLVKPFRRFVHGTYRLRAHLIMNAKKPLRVVHNCIRRFI